MNALRRSRRAGPIRCRSSSTPARCGLAVRGSSDYLDARLHRDRDGIEVLHRSAFQRRGTGAGRARFAISMRASAIPPGLLEYSSCSDWPQNWPVLRSRFPVRTNFGQWLRWEAAIEEIGAYYRVPDSFRQTALDDLRQAVERLIAASPSLELLPWQDRPIDAADEELAQRTIFSFVDPARRTPSVRSAECRTLYRALAGNAGDLKPAAQAMPDRPAGCAWGAIRHRRPHFGSAPARGSSRKRGRRTPIWPHRNLQRAIDDRCRRDRQSRSLAGHAWTRNQWNAAHGS